MAVKRLVDVFSAHRTRVIGIAVLLEIAVLSSLTILLVNSGIYWVVVSLYVLLPVAVLQLLSFIIILSYAMEPLSVLSRAITHVSGQVSNVTPPNLNGTRHERTGFKLMVDTIYGLATTGPARPEESAGVTSLQGRMLDGISAGVIALNEKRQVIYANTAAPIIKSEAGTSIQLLFETEDSLEEWLRNVETSQVSAARIWSRVQNVLPDQPDRRIYDVIANYQKNGAEGVDTILLCIDRSAYYAINEESMDFIALAAHELRGPVTVIRGYLDVLQQELTLTPDQIELFHRLEVSANRLSGYIGNILNASKFDRRHLKLHLREDKLSEVYALVADDLALRASTQQRILSITIPPDLPTVAADRNSLSEVLANFIDNGIKYSHEGGQITVSAGVEGDFVRVNVTDTGIGVPAALVGNLFNKFYRSHTSRQTVPGTGLGLYISKAIIESHGGHVGVTTRENEGSTFSFTIPIYATVADKLLSAENTNQGIIESGTGWIKNHSMIRR